jgi:hypothetical protein
MDAHRSWRVEIFPQLQHVAAPDLFQLIAQRWLAALCAPGTGSSKIWGLTEKLLQVCNSADGHRSRFQRWLGFVGDGN